MDSIFESRIRRLIGAGEERGLRACILLDPSNIYYLSGFRGSALILMADEACLLVPRLDLEKAEYDVKVRGLRVLAFSSYKLPMRSGEELLIGDLPKVVASLMSRYGIKDGRIGADDPRISFRNSLIKELPKIETEDISRCVSGMRIIKDRAEIGAMERAISISEDGMRAAMDSIAEGRAECEIAGAAEEAMRRSGAEGFAFDTIVAAGWRSSYPHAAPSCNELKSGDVVVIDLGARFGGYCSDITRTVSLNPSPEQRRLLEAVIEAQDAAIDSIEPGVKASEVDSAARSVLEREGLSRNFIHGTGHGIGIDVHEFPRICPGGDEELRPGMVTTIEPGIYIHGYCGIRVEDVVLVAERKARVLSRLERTISW